MGRLVTKGKGRKKYEAEIMVISVSFQKKGLDTKYILEKVQEQCEMFLKELNDIGISPEQIRFEDKGIKKKYGEDENTIERKIVIRTKIDVKLCTYICSLIRKYSSDIIYEILYEIEDEETKSQELLKLAVKDSRRQAEIIAESIGKVVKGIESVNDEVYIHRNLARGVVVDEGMNPQIPEVFDSNTPLTDRAALPVIEKSEEITVAWIMND